jgi:hypothetical protein
MSVITENIALFWEALFLNPKPYATMRDQKNPVTKGVVLLVILGLALALANLIGSVLTWASSPDLMAVKDVILRNMQQMAWWQMMSVDPQATAMFLQIWNSVWQAVAFLNPTPASGLLGFVTTPLVLIITWLLFGVLAFLMAKLFGGHGGLGQTLGTTALAAAPQLLGLFNFVPYLTLAGIGIWTILARYMAIRVTHDLSWGRAAWVTVLTMVILYILVFLLAGAGAVVFGITMASAIEGG